MYENVYIYFKDVKISDDNILSDIMSDLDGSASSTVKPKPLVPNKVNIVESNKREAQNYFKNLSSSVKKPTVLKEEPIKKTIVIEDSIADTKLDSVSIIL